MSTPGVYHDECRGYHEHSGVFSSLGDITSTLGDTKMHVEDYHEYTRGVQYTERIQ